MSTAPSRRTFLASSAAAVGTAAALHPGAFAAANDQTIH